MKNDITPEQEKVVDNLHNLIWHRITNDNKYLEAIPEIDSGNFHDWIYHIRYQFLEYSDSRIDAVVYLNGKHYEYMQTPQFLNNVWVNEIKESEVEAKIVEIGGEIYDGFVLYNHIDVAGEKVTKNKFLEATKLSVIQYDDDQDYYDLPF